MKRFLALLLGVLFATGAVWAQQIVRAEYFVDDDPGLGLGTAISVSPGADVTLNFAVATAGLDGGFHTLYVRSTGDSGPWSIVHATPFFKALSPAPPEGDVAAMEYFIDIDPGQGLGSSVSISAGQDVTGSFSVSLGGVSPGFHTLHVRSQNTAGEWNNAYPHPFFKTLPAGPGEPDVVAMEYFIDIDPGQGLGSSVSISAGQDVTGAFSVSLGGVSPGFHTLYVRSQNTTGRWNKAYPHSFFTMLPAGPGEPDVVAMEYFIDADPGQGLGNAVSVSGGQDVTQGFSVDLSGTAAGFHTLYVRGRDVDGIWNTSFAYPFFKILPATPPDPNITAMEYFFDSDPGQGLASSISLSAGQDVTGSVSVGLSGVSSGFHTLYVRGRDVEGTWSLLYAHPFFKGFAVPSGKADITRLEYFIDADPGFGLASSVPMTPGQDRTVLYSVDLQSVPPGFHTLYVRGQDSTLQSNIAYAHPFFKAYPTAASPGAITRLEYYFDLGGIVTPKRSFTSFAAGGNLTVNFAPDLSGLVSDSVYVMHISAVDTTGSHSVAYVSGGITVVTDVEGVTESILPTSVELAPNYPNPFNPETVIRFGLPKAGQIRLVVYNTLGQEVVELLKGSFPAGYHQVLWNGRNGRNQQVGSGMYIYRLVSDQLTLTRKMALVR